MIKNTSTGVKLSCQFELTRANPQKKKNPLASTISKRGLSSCLITCRAFHVNGDFIVGIQQEKPEKEKIGLQYRLALQVWFLNLVLLTQIILFTVVQMVMGFFLSFFFFSLKDWSGEKKEVSKQQLLREFADDLLTAATVAFSCYWLHTILPRSCRFFKNISQVGEKILKKKKSKGGEIFDFPRWG